MIKRILPAILGLALCFSVVSPAWAYEAQLKPFRDVPAGDWAEQDIYSLTALSILSGYEDRTFRPNASVTREAFVKMLVSSLPELQSQTFTADIPAMSDVAKDRWSYPVIQLAAQLHLTDFMVKDGAFLPESEITREEVAALVGKFLLLQQPEQERKLWASQKWQVVEAAGAFKDKEKVTAGYRPNVYYANYQGIMTGDDQRMLHPQDALSRKEAAAIIHRTIQKRVSGSKLTAVGFYALGSYANIDKMSLLTGVNAGWSRLKYAGAGIASLDTSSSEFKLPDGYEGVLDKAKANGVSSRLMVFADNKDGILSKFLQDRPAQEAFLKSLSDAVAKLSVNGVSIDFEGLVQEADKAPFTAFLQSIKQLLGGKAAVLSVAVPPVFYYAGYDLKAIGTVADEVVLMAYNFTHMVDGLPSAPLPLVQESVVQALEQGVPKEKLLLGISKKTDQWITDAAGKMQTANPAPELVEARLKMDGVEQSFALPYFLRHATYTTANGSNELWYEDTQSIEAKIELARYYGLKGIALWHMGSFTTNDWALIGDRNAK